jgi:DNA-directed RNA polymerase subunit RPC12/RpoP
MLHMGKCSVCGNEYDRTMEITLDGISRVFDSFDCAIHALAPICAHCGVRIIGHGMESGGVFYCCAHCARSAGIRALQDRA